MCHASRAMNFAGLIAATLVVLVGCGRGDGRVEVSGTVKVDGKTLDSGVIRFVPVDLNSARGSGTAIRSGEYHIPAEQGLTPAKYVVTIQASEKTGRMIPHPHKGQIEEYRELRFAESGTLEVEVVSDNSARFDFQLTTLRQGP